MFPAEVVEQLDLEVVCADCNGSGGDPTARSKDRWRCFACKGAGFVPTQFGKKILALIQHNFEPTLREANED